MATLGELHLAAMGKMAAVMREMATGLLVMQGVPVVKTMAMMAAMAVGESLLNHSTADLLQYATCSDVWYSKILLQLY